MNLIERLKRLFKRKSTIQCKCGHRFTFEELKKQRTGGKTVVYVGGGRKNVGEILELECPECGEVFKKENIRLKACFVSSFSEEELTEKYWKEKYGEDTIVNID